MTDTLTYHVLSAQNADLLIGSIAFDKPVDPVELAAFVADPGHLLVFVTAQSEVVGFASGAVIRHPDQPPCLFVNEVGVEEPWRCQGIGRTLCERLFTLAREAGCKGIWVPTEVDNAPARALYQRLQGRETTGIVVYDWDGAMDS